MQRIASTTASKESAGSRAVNKTTRPSPNQMNSTVFENDMCKVIYNGISKGCEQLFSQYKSNFDIQNNRFATVDLAATRMTLLLNMSNNDGNYPIFQSTFLTFTAPQQQQQQQQQQQNPNISKNINKRQHEQDPTRRTCFKQESKPSFTTEIPKYWKGLSNMYKTANVIIPKTNLICNKLNHDSNATFATSLGINAKDCINYCIKGECLVKDCKQNHLAKPKPTESIIVKAYIDMLKDLQSKT